MKTTIIALLGLALLPCAAHAEMDRSRTVTGPQGNSATRNVSGSYTQGSGYSRNATTTGSNGQTSSSSRQITAAPHGRQVQSTYQGPNGNTASADVYHGRRGHLKAGALTGPQGNTRRFIRFR